MNCIEQTIEHLEAKKAQVQELIDGLRRLDFAAPKLETPAIVTVNTRTPAQENGLQKKILKTLKEATAEQKTRKPHKGSQIEKVREALTKVKEPFTVHTLGTIAGVKQKIAENFLYHARHRGDIVEAGAEGVKKLYARKGFVVKTTPAKAPSSIPAALSNYEQQKRELLGADKSRTA